MTTDDVYAIIRLIDIQLSKVELHTNNKCAVDHLLELRNNILLETKPDPIFNWTIKNKVTLKVVDFFKYQISWA